MYCVIVICTSTVFCNEVCNIYNGSSKSGSVYVTALVNTAHMHRGRTIQYTVELNVSEPATQPRCLVPLYCTSRLIKMKALL